MLAMASDHNKKQKWGGAETLFLVVLAASEHYTYV
jgi:hypothetical protein